MSIDTITKEEIIAKIANLEQPEKLKCMALYDNLVESYKNEHELNLKTRNLYYSNNQKEIELYKDLKMILEGNNDAINKYIDDKNLYFTEEELKSDEYSKPLSNIFKDYYFNTIKKHEFLNQFITEEDLKILSYISNIEFYNHKDNDNITLKFYFLDNEYFSNNDITIEMLADKNNVTEIIEVKSTDFNWKANKDPRYKIVKGKNKKNKRTKVESFFHYFCNIKNEDIEEDEEDEEDPLSDRSIFIDSVEIMNLFKDEIMLYSIPTNYFDVEVECFKEEGIEGDNPEKPKVEEKKPECNNQ